MRFHITAEQMNLLGEQPNQGQLGPPDTLLIHPSRPRESEIFFRVGRRGPRQMPPLATNLVDERGLEVLRQWIAGMDQN